MGKIVLRSGRGTNTGHVPPKNMSTVLGTIRFDQFWLAFESFESREQY